MKIISTMFLLLSSCILFAQYNNTSFFFDTNRMDSIPKFEGFSEKEMGYYEVDKDTYTQMVVTKDSISVRFGSEIIIPKSVAIAKGYTFDGEKMYGIAPLDGVYYKEYNDTIFALYYQTDKYFSNGTDDFIIPVGDNYLLFIKEPNGFFSCEMLSLKGKKMTIYSIDHTEVMDKLLTMSTIYTRQIQGVKTYIANPKLEEMTVLSNKENFTDKRQYLLNKKL